MVLILERRFQDICSSVFVIYYFGFWSPSGGSGAHDSSLALRRLLTQPREREVLKLFQNDPKMILK